jgi:hypothetical protein
MDAKITLSFEKEVIEQAKAYAKSKGRLTEVLLRRLTNEKPYSLEDFPVADWVNNLAEGEAKYIKKQASNKSIRAQYHQKK